MIAPIPQTLLVQPVAQASGQCHAQGQGEGQSQSQGHAQDQGQAQAQAQAKPELVAGAAGRLLQPAQTHFKQSEAVRPCSGTLQTTSAASAAPLQ